MDKKERNQKYNMNDLPNTLKIVPFYIFLLLFSLLLSYGSQIVMNKSYRIINDNKVIVYTTNDYYLTLDCEIKDNKLTIYFNFTSSKLINSLTTFSLLIFVCLPL